MTQRVAKQCSVLLILVVILTTVYGTREILTERCEDRYGASLKENFALNKVATQSSTSNEGAAGRLVDGNHNPYFTNGSCSETALGSSSWKVDLATDVYVTSVTITTRADGDWKVEDRFTITVIDGSTSQWRCASGTFVDNGRTTTYVCETVRKGRLVEITVQGTKRLSLCEVEVYGRLGDFYEHEVNYALFQAAKQTDVYGGWSAAAAVDGNRNTEMGSGSCAHTANLGGDWWVVHLGKRIDVYAVVVTDRDITNRMADFEVRVGDNWHPSKNSNCAGRQSLAPGETRAIFCSRPVPGATVGIIQRLQEAINFCEISVHGRQIGRVFANEPVCLTPKALGMEDFTILDAQLTSSSYLSINHRVNGARLNAQADVGLPGAWCAKKDDLKPWMQVAFLWPVAVTEVLTQGRQSTAQWATKFEISSSDDFVRYESFKYDSSTTAFPGNSDKDSIVRHRLQPVRVLRIIRINIISYHNHPSMRVEFVGCYYKDKGFPLPRALGMQSKAISDTLLNSSTQWNSNLDATHARLGSSRAWIARDDSEPWLQVDFVLTVTVIEILTQGRPGHDHWTENYKVSYAQQAGVFKVYSENGRQKLFTGNTDGNTIVRNALSPAIRAQFVRLHPKEHVVHHVMRVEFLGYYPDEVYGPLGLEDGRILNSQLSASFERPANYGPRDGRVNGPRAWDAALSDDQWLQVDFWRLVEVTEIWTQGRTDINPHQYIKTYKIMHSLDTINFIDYQPYGWEKTFSANNDGYAIVRTPVFPPIVSRVIRVLPKSWHRWISLRMEVFGRYVTSTVSCHYAKPLGMESGEISDMQITASSAADDNHLPRGARLNFPYQDVSGFGWAASQSDRTAWLQVAFHEMANVVEIQTQGRVSNQWIHNYTVSYGNNGVQFQSYEQDDKIKVFDGNFDTTTIVRHALWPAVTARFVRINAVSCGGYCALRAEFIGTYEAAHGPELIDPDYVQYENTLSASSFADQHHQPYHGIITNRLHATTWSPVRKESGEYIQVDLRQPTAISGVGFRLAADKIQGDHYTKLTLWFGDSEQSLRLLKDNHGKITLLDTRDCFQAFEKILLARFVRLAINSWQTRPDFGFQLYGTTVYSETSAGVETGSIKDHQMMSSNHPNDPYKAHEGRLNGPSAWCGNPLQTRLYLQLDFDWDFEVHAVATQGKTVGIIHYVTHYKLSSTMDGVFWSLYQEEELVKIFPGNTNCRCIRKHPVQPFLARALRFLPSAWREAPCMRVDVYGIYKGFLRIRARSGVVVGLNGTVVTRKCSIKLNGKEVSKRKQGYNVVVANPRNGVLISSSAVEDSSSLNKLITTLPDDSIVVIATQNITERPPSESIYVLESIGAIRLRYSLAESQHFVFLLAGFKGAKKVNWIQEKLGNSSDGAVRISVSIKLNKKEIQPTIKEHFAKPDNETDEADISLPGDSAYISRNITSKCGENNTDCEIGLSLAMWMKLDQDNHVEKQESSPTPERVELQYYSQGYNYILLRDKKVWEEANKYCLGVGAHLPVIRDQRTRSYLYALLTRLGLQREYSVGLRIHPRTKDYSVWVDGSPLVHAYWRPNEPTGLPERCVDERVGMNDIPCTTTLNSIICQQPVEAVVGADLFPLGIESGSISDDSLSASSEYSADNHAAKYARLHTESKKWCSKDNEKTPFIQVNFRKATKICAVGTRGRGVDLSYISYPTLYSVHLTNDSINWATVKHEGRKKVFRGNRDNFGVVINRLPQVEIAQIVRISIEARVGVSLCMRIELFGCQKTVEAESVQKFQPTIPPRSITENTPRSCLDMRRNGKTTDGVYLINPYGTGAFPVFCDQTTDDGGWTVFQRRADGYVDFDKTWAEYKAGFGDVYGEHWLGLEHISRMTHAGAFDLRIDLEAWDGTTTYIVYFLFRVSDEASHYVMSYNTYAAISSVGNSLLQHNYQRFATKDNNIDTKPLYHLSGWWFGPSVKASLNGKYFPSADGSGKGIFWHSYRQYKSLKSCKMMIREGVSFSGSALGLEVKYVRDYEMTASSATGGWPAQAARLNNAAGAWSVGYPGAYLQVNFIAPQRITHISTQGGSDFNFVSEFYVKFLLVDGTWVDYKERGKKKIFEGNNIATRQTNINTIISNCFKEPVEAMVTRVYPVKCDQRCSLRMELYSCNDDACSAPVGIGSDFPLDRISASSSTNQLSNARLYSPNVNWRAAHSLPVEYVEVHFPELYRVTGIATRGGTFATNGKYLTCFLMSYYLMYVNTRQKWIFHGGQKPKILPANTNGRSTIKTNIDSPFLAHTLRLVAKSWYNVVCLKFEVYGCYPDNPSFIVYTDSVLIGAEFQLRGQYRYCQNCGCPGCVKSVCLRVFGKVYLAATRLENDCRYHEVDITARASSIPGRHRVHLIESEYGNCHENSEVSSERIVGNINVKKDPSNCLELLLSGNAESGKYSIDPDGKGSFQVYCEQDLYGGGWTVFQRRASMEEDFHRDWNAYKQGFGDVEKDFWLGNEYLHRLTKEKRELVFELHSVTDEDTAFVLHKTFQVSDEDDGYRLHVADYEESPAGNCIQNNNGQKFTARDRDNDENSENNCALIMAFGWWFGDCSPACRVNGKPLDSAQNKQKMKYKTWTDKISLQKAEMKLRDRETVFCNHHYCYYLVKTWDDWFGASEQCRRFHSNLVSIRNASENEWIREEILENLGIEKVYIGLKNNTWLDGGSFDFHNFSSNVESEQCSILNQDGSWQLQDCAMKSRILCKRGKWCFRERCHVLGYERLPYKDSVKYCDNIGYKLTKIRNAEENDYMSRVIRASTDDSGWRHAYIGLNLDSQPPRWHDGTAVRYTNWKAGEPNQSHKIRVKFWPDGWADAEDSAIWTASPLCEKVYQQYPLDCLDLLLSGAVRSGVYTVDPDGLGPIQVYCDQETFGGGWTLLLRRVEPSVNFDRDWREYAVGFGDLDGDVWLGNDFNHRLTKTEQEVLFDLESDIGDKSFALYKTFQVADEESKYRLKIEGFQASVAGDGMENNMKFTTKDQDNDGYGQNCAALKKGGWWHNGCSSAFLTGSYNFADHMKKISWKTWPSNNNIRRAEMKIRSQSVVTCGKKFCYYLTNQKKTWSEALRECRSFNADLVSIHDLDESTFILDNILRPNSVDDVHLGLTQFNHWTDGSPRTYNLLSSSLTDTTCASLSKTASWVTNDCLEKKRVVCKRGKHCYKGDCYFVESTLSIHSGAKQFCEKTGYKLAKLSTQEESEYLSRLVRESTADTSEPWTYIGLVLTGEDRLWPDGTMLKFDGWRGSEPNGGGWEPSVVLTDGTFVDIFMLHLGPSLCEKAPIIKDCNEVKLKYGRSDSGVYAYSSNDRRTFPVHCQLDDNDNDDSWLVIQRRVQDSVPVDFEKQPWTAYRDGFGTKESNFWLGNKFIHELTWDNPHRLKIVLYEKDFDTYEAVYEDFYLSSEESGFTIHFGAYSGNAGDALSRHRGMPFSTTDRDNSANSCTASHPGGWWFADCLDSNLNGKFAGRVNAEDNIFWRTIALGLVSTEMKIQPYEPGSRKNRTTLFNSTQTTSLSLSSKENWMEINLRTSSQQWITHVLHPGPFITHVAVTWKENSYLRYYENGTLVAEVPGSVSERPGYPYTSLSAFVDLPRLWLHRMKLWNEGMTSEDVCSHYVSNTFTFDDEDELKWTFLNQTSSYSWETRQNCTPSNRTGPCGDHTHHSNTGTFVISEASKPASPMDTAVMESPALVDAYNCLSFWYHFYGRRIGSLNVNFSTSSEESNLLVEVSGNRGNYWRLMEVDLKLSGVSQIKIEATRGEGFEGDIAIDDISLSSEKCKKECKPACKAGTICDSKSLQCVFQGIYDHRWTFDSLDIKDDKAAFSSSSSNGVTLAPGVLYKAVQLTSSMQLASMNDYCYRGTCLPKYTLSLWLKYKETYEQTILALNTRFQIAQNKHSIPKDHLSITVDIPYRKCVFILFAPPDIWTHVILVLDDGNFTTYLNGDEVTNTTIQCNAHSSSLSGNNNLILGGKNIVFYESADVAIDDLRLLFDARPEEDTLRNYRTITGFDQSVWFKAKFTTVPWLEQLCDDESDVYITQAKFLSSKIMAALGNRSSIKDVEVLKFMLQGSTTAEVNIVYHDVSYQDILLLEESIYANKTFNDLAAHGMEIGSTSVPSLKPRNFTAVAPNSTALVLSWKPMFPEHLNGVFQGYKILYKQTENSSYTHYTLKTKYANYTTTMLTKLEPLTNYTLRILAFTLSGDGLPSDPIIVSTPDGEVTDSPNTTVTSISSTSLYVNWTVLPSSTEDYVALLGYKMSYWKDPEKNNVSKMIFNIGASAKLFENLGKWTEYCFEISGYTMAGVGPNVTKCTRTLEDAPEAPPSNVTVVHLTTSAVHITWAPPPSSAVPGILRYYNISYRVLNISDSEVQLTVPAANTSYAIEGLTGLLLCEVNITAFTIESGPTHSLQVLTYEGVPLVAPNMTFVITSSTSATMNWTRLPWKFHNGILLGYKMFMWKKSDGIQFTFDFSPKEVYKRVKDLSKWTIYCAKIVGFTAVGDGPASSTDCNRTFEDAPEEAPGDFDAVEVNVTTIKLTWEAPPGASVPGIVRQYSFVYRNLNYSEENRTSLELGATERSYTLEQLHGLTLYEFNITAITITPGPWSTLHVLTDEGVPVIAPPNIQWYNLSSTSLKSNWSVLPPQLCHGILLGYRVYLWKQSDGPSTAFSTTVAANEQVKLFENLEKWTIYCGLVAAFTRIGEGPRSQVECIRTFEDEPEVPPSHLNGTNTTWTSCFLTWDSIHSSFVPGILRWYRVTYTILDPGFNGSYDGSFLVNSQDTAVNLTGLIGLTSYNVTVSGVTTKDGPIVEIIMQTKEGVPTSGPEEVTPTEVTSTTIAVSWSDIFIAERHGVIKGYEVTYRKADSRSKRDVAETFKFDADVHSAFFFKLVPFTNYTVTVAGYTSKGLGVEKHFVIETAEAAPRASPKGFYGTNFTGPTTIFVGWGSLNTEELQGRLAGYEVRYREFSVADEVLLEPTPEVVRVVPSGRNGLRITGLSTYTTYRVSVAAVTGGGIGIRTGILYVATCRCHKRLTTNYWNFQPYANISGQNTDRGFFPYLLDMVTLSCCQHCLEHGTSYVDYFNDGLGKPSERQSDIAVKTSMNLNTDLSFPIYGYKGQTSYMRYYGYASMIEIVGTVFFTLKPDYSVTQSNVLLEAVLSIVPFLAIAVIFAYIAGVIIWALECGANEDEFPSRFFMGAANGFWWAYVTMTTVGYGDKTARTFAGRVFAVVWVLTGLVICSLLIGTIATAFTTSTTPPDPEDVMIYGSKVAALQDSPDHRLGLRRNAKVNSDNKTYESLKELQKVLLSGTVDGILVDAYVADARKDLFSSSRFMIKKVIDLTSSYGVVMGSDAKKLRKCFNRFWKVNAATRSAFIQNNSNPVKITEISTEELVGEAYNPQSALYTITLYSCAAVLCVLSLCGCVYELMRRKKQSTQVHSEEPSFSTSSLRDETTMFVDELKENIANLRLKQRNEIIALSSRLSESNKSTT